MPARDEDRRFRRGEEWSAPRGGADVQWLTPILGPAYRGWTRYLARLRAAGDGARGLYPPRRG